MTSAQNSGPLRLVGTWDSSGTLLFSQGFKNFSDRTPCLECEIPKGLMHRYAVARKGATPVVDPGVFCSVDCFRKYSQQGFTAEPLP